MRAYLIKSGKGLRNFSREINEKFRYFSRRYRTKYSMIVLIIPVYKHNSFFFFFYVGCPFYYLRTLSRSNPDFLVNNHV